MNISVRTKLSVIIATAVSGWHALGIVAYNTPDDLNPANVQTGGSYILGNMFTVNAPINVTSIGAYDYLNNGFSGSGVQVAIYSLSGSTWSQVAGTFTAFPVGASGSYIGDTLFKSIVPVTLGAGNYAIVAANYGTAGNPDWNANLGVGNTPRVTFQNASANVTMSGPNTSFYATGSTLAANLPALTYGAWGGAFPTFGAGNFEFAPVPEASHFALAGMGLLGLVYVGRAFVSRKQIA